MLCLAACLAASCAKDSGGGKPSTSSGSSAFKPFSQRIAENQSTKNDWTTQREKRSSFEKQGDSPHFQNKYKKKGYKAEGYKKRSWWGNKNYDSRSYAGNTDGSRFQTTSRAQGNRAKESGGGSKFRNTYQTDGYSTGAARETSASSIPGKTDAYADGRRESYPQPEIIDWREQRSLSVEQSNGILGR